MTIAFRSVIHESTLNNKLAAVPALWLISPPPPPPQPPKMLISTFSGWEEVVISMHVCMYLCKVVVGKRYACKCIPFHCVRVMVTSCVHVQRPYWVVRAMHGCWMDDCDEWQWWCLVRSCERVIEWIWWIEWMHEWMNTCMDWLLFVCVCVVYVVGWFGRLVCRVEQSPLQVVDKEPLRIAISL